MKRTTSRILITAVFMLALAASWAHANLLVNPSFEDSIPFFGWTRFTKGASPELITTGAQDQQNCVKIFQDFSGQDNWCGLYQDTPVTPNTPYRIALYMRNGNETGQDGLQPGNSAFAKVEWYNAAGELISAEEVNTGKNGLQNVSPSGQWMLNEATVTSPDKATLGRVVLIHVFLGQTFEGGSSWFDNVVFQQAL